MSDPILLLDCNYLAFRAFFSCGSMTYGNRPTDILFGFLRDIDQLRTRFCTDQLVFCFDHGPSKRVKVYPDYKRSRQTKSYTETDAHNIVARQIKDLKNEVLPGLGFVNILSAKGYEGDDIIASALNSSVGLFQNSDRVMVSGDNDLFQLLDRAMLFNPRTKVLRTEKTFRDQYKMSPSNWAHVKAIAGCRSDDIAGIAGVGEITAVKYLNDMLGRTAMSARNKIRNGTDIWQRNLPLVRLPFEGCPEFVIKWQQPISPAAWRHVTRELGMKSLEGKGDRERSLFDGN